MMRRLLIFLISGILIIGFVFIYAQKNRNKIKYINPYKQSSKPRVLGTNNINNKQSSTPLTIKIDKNPVLLYWMQKITIETLPNIEVRTKVTYPNGSANNSGTVNTYSDKNGKVMIQWTIRGGKGMTGIASVEVSAGSLDTYKKASAQFEISESKKNNTTLPATQASPTAIPTQQVQSIPNTLPNSP